MSSNYEINMKKILDDYYKCLGAFKNCSILYEQHTKINKKNGNSTQEEIEIRKGMEEDLLSNLGKVGEKAFKYIIGLENLRISPNQDSNNFESLWKKNKTLTDFAKKHGINEDDEKLNDIFNYYDENNQKAHNFDYWYSIMNLTMKDISNKFETFMKYIMLNEILMEYCQENNEFRITNISKYSEANEISLPFRAAIFPNLIELQYEHLPEISNTQIKFMIDTKNEAIKKNGDIFTRLRYASNNPTKQTFNLDEVYQIMNNIITFIQMIHEENNDLNFDLIKTFAKYKSLEYSNILNVSKEEIINLFSLNLTGAELSLTIYENNYPYSSLKRLLEIGVPKEDLRKAITEGLQPKIIEHFYRKGIRNFLKMRELIDYYNKYGEQPDQYLALRKR